MSKHVKKLSLVVSQKYESLIHAVALLILALPLTSLSQTKINPVSISESPQKEIEIGQEAAIDVEKELVILRNAYVTGYVNRLGQTLAAQAPGERYPYNFKVINGSDINTISLPGGPIYINRGTIEACQSEGELAGIIAHEIAHVALRHPLGRVKREQMAQMAGLMVGILSSISQNSNSATAESDKSKTPTAGSRKTKKTTSDSDKSKKQSQSDVFATSTATMISYGYNLGYNLQFESAADILGAQILAQAGYSPLGLASFFERITSQNPYSIENFFKSHPFLSSRISRIKQEAGMLTTSSSPREIGGFAEVLSTLARLPKPPIKKLNQDQGKPNPPKGKATKGKQLPSSGNQGGKPSAGDKLPQSSVVPQQTRYPAVDPNTIINDPSVAVIAIPSDGEFYFSKDKIAQTDIIPRVRDKLNGKPFSERIVYIKSSKTVMGGTIAKVLGLIRDAGVDRIRLVVEGVESRAGQAVLETLIAEKGIDAPVFAIQRPAITTSGIPLPRTSGVPGEIPGQIDYPKLLVVEMKTGNESSQTVKLNGNAMLLTKLGGILKRAFEYRPIDSKAVAITVRKDKLFGDLLSVIQVAKEADAQIIALVIDDLELPLSPPPPPPPPLKKKKGT